MQNFPDLEYSTRRVPLHLLMSLPFAAAAFFVPPLGKKYVAWRAKAEADDLAAGRDSTLKAAQDLYSQTWLVRGAMSFWKLF